MKRALIFSAILIVAAPLAPWNVAAEESQAAEPLKRGIYIERTGEPAVERLRATMTTESRTTGMAKAMFGGRPNVILVVPGATADLRLTTPEPSFRLVLSAAKQVRDFSDPSQLAEMSEAIDAPGPMAKEGKDFVLVRLVLKEGDRELDIKKGKVAVAVEKIGDKTYRLKPAKPLDPGEYAVCQQASGMPVGQIWEFGIQQ